MLNKILILLLILFQIYITKFRIQALDTNIIIIIKLAQASMSYLLPVPKFYTPTHRAKTNIIFSSNQIHLMTCQIPPKDSDLQAPTCFYSIYPTVWKILSYIIYSKNMVLFFQQESWLRKMENPRALDLSALITPLQLPKPYKKWTGSRSKEKD